METHHISPTYHARCVVGCRTSGVGALGRPAKGSGREASPEVQGGPRCISTLELSSIVAPVTPVTTDQCSLATCKGMGAMDDGAQGCRGQTESALSAGA